jgi:thiamine biosynthesis protein ThiS
VSESLRASAIEIRLNGRATEIAASATLADLLASLGADPLTVAIERNGEIVRRASFAGTALAAGDAIEIVRFVQGG